MRRGAPVGIPTVNYGLDGEGRRATATDATHSLSLSASTTYNAGSLPLETTLGNSDSDTFSYDPNTFRPATFKHAVTGSGAFNITGALTWNANASLKSFTFSKAILKILSRGSYPQRYSCDSTAISYGP